MGSLRYECNVTIRLPISVAVAGEWRAEEEN